MPISPEQQYSEYGLLVPRPTVKFRDLSGVKELADKVRVEPVNSEVDLNIKPVVITSREHYDYEGVRSQGRGGIILFGGVKYKIKGCRVELALESQDLYRETHASNVPKGGQLLSDVVEEIENTRKSNELLIAEGFSVPYEPEAIIHYGKVFKSNRAGIFLSKVARAVAYTDPGILFEHLLDQDELAASVMKIKSDTRLLDFYSRRIRNEEAALTIAYRFGLIAGAQKRVTEDFYWISHVGNYVIFIEDNKVHLSMVDLGDAISYQDLKFKFLNSKRRNFEINHILRSADRSRLAVRMFYWSHNVPKERRFNVPKYFREAFAKGFMDGYKNPDKREPITLDMLVEAFDLGTPILPE
jgi:hypothetical protein